MGTGAPRPESWAKTFVKEGHEVTVVSRYWSGEEKNWNDYLKSTPINAPQISKEGKLTKVFLPYKEREYSKFGLIRKFSSVFNLMSGNLEREVDSMYYFDHIEEMLAENKFDFMVATCPPWNLSKLAFKIWQSFKIPFALDYRDYENDVILPLNPKLSSFRKFEFFWNTRYMKKWIAKSKFIAGASKPIVDYVMEQNKIPGYEITNGYNQKLISKIKESQAGDIFTISIIGFLYPPQDLTILIKGLNQFFEKNQNIKFKFNFIGVNAIKEVADKLRANLPAKYINITDRIPQEEALRIGSRSNVLFYAGWSNWKGVYSAKIFEYLALERRILIAPGDNFAIDKIIEESRSGEVINSINDFDNLLTLWYNEWEENGYLSWSGDQNYVTQFSREAQAIKLLEAIKNEAVLA